MTPLSNARAVFCLFLFSFCQEAALFMLALAQRIHIQKAEPWAHRAWLTYNFSFCCHPDMVTHIFTENFMAVGLWHWLRDWFGCYDTKDTGLQYWATLFFLVLGVGVGCYPIKDLGTTCCNNSCVDLHSILKKSRKIPVFSDCGWLYGWKL